MKYLKLQTIEDYNALNDAISASRGYPNNITGTERYAPDDPEITEVTELNESGEEVVVESYYKFPLAEDIFSVVSLMAGKPLVIDDTEMVIPNGYQEQIN